MNMAKQRNLWPRMWYTPVFDLLRGRMTGRMDIEQLLDASELPAEVSQLVRHVVRRTRLWRFEKFDVAAELIAHFRDGLESGSTPKKLTKDFGDTLQAARLIRRAKIRNRPWMWHAMRALMLTVTGTVGVYALLLCLLLCTGPAKPVDYLPYFNAPALAVPQEDRAWPIYREAILAGVGDIGRWRFKVQAGRNVFHPVDVGDPNWPEAAAFIKEQVPILNLIRAAAAKPGLGLVVTHNEKMEAADRAALLPAANASSDQDHPDAEQFALRPIYTLKMPHLEALDRMANLLAIDTQLAWQQDDHPRVLANLDAILAIARHSRETPFRRSANYARNIEAMAVEEFTVLLRRDPAWWSRERLTFLSEAMAQIDLGTKAQHDGERMFWKDNIQRLYSDRGYITRDGLKYFFRFVTYRDEQPDLTIGLPLANVVIASRAKMEAQLDRLMTMLAAQSTMPFWEMQKSEYASAIKALERNALMQWRYRLVIVQTEVTATSQKRAAWELAYRDALLVAIAMELYRRDNGRYPESLAALSPTYLAVPPVDFSTGGLLRVAYPDDGDFILYGLGKNGKDDGGVSDYYDGDWVLYPPRAR